MSAEQRGHRRDWLAQTPMHSNYDGQHDSPFKCSSPSNRSSHWIVPLERGFQSRLLLRSPFGPSHPYLLHCFRPSPK